MTTFETEIEKILIFKTNIKSDLEHFIIKATLDPDEKVKEWSVDREDVDCVLRIKSDSLTENNVIELIKNAGFNCEELDH